MTVSWTGKGDGENWFDKSNWSGEVIPTFGDEVFIPFDPTTDDPIIINDDVFIGSLATGRAIRVVSSRLAVDFTATFNDDVSLESATLGFTLPLAKSMGEMIFNGTTTVSGTRVECDLINNGKLTIGGSKQFDITGEAIVTNAGGATLDFKGPGMLISNSKLINEGQFTLTTSAPIFEDTSGATNGTGQIINNGTMTKTGPVEPINVEFYNNGKLTIASGELVLPNEGGFSNTGMVTLSHVTSILRLAGEYDFDSHVSGIGTLEIDSDYRTAVITGTGGGVITNSATNVSLISGQVHGVWDIGGSWEWSGGGVYGSVDAGGIVEIRGSGQKDLAGGGLVTLKQTAVATWSGSGGIHLNHATLINEGTFQSLGNATMFQSNPGTFRNDGTFLKLNGTGKQDIKVDFDNTGTFEVATGLVNLDAGGANSGSFVVHAGSELALSGGSHAFQAASEVSGDGVFTFGGGTSQIDTTEWSLTGLVKVTDGTHDFDADATFENLMISGGIFQGVGSIAVNGTWNWTGGMIRKSMTSDGALIISGSGQKTLAEGKIINAAGTASWSDSGGISMRNGLFINDAAFTIATNASIFENAGSGRLVNNGNLTHSVAGTRGINLPFDSTGTLTIDSGELSLDKGGMIAGQVNIHTGASLRLNSTYTLDEPLITGPGTLKASASSITATGEGVTIGEETTFALSGGTIHGAWTIDGSWDWTGGVVQASAVSKGLLTLGGPSQKDVVNGSLVTNGQTTWSDGFLQLFSSSLTNHGVFHSETNKTVFGSGSFVNFGVFVKCGGAETQGFNVDLFNHGTILVRTGTLNFTQPGWSSGSMHALTGATLGIAHNFTLSSTLIGGGGTVTITTGTISAPNAGVEVAETTTLNLYGGTIQGTWQVYGTTNWTLAKLEGNLTAHGDLTFSGASQKSVVNGALAIAGSAVWMEGNFLQLHNATLRIDEGGSFESQNGFTTFGSGSIQNYGTFSKTLGGDQDVKVPFTNNGTVAVESVTGAINFNSSFTQNAGETLVNNGTIRPSGSAGLQINAGKVGGSGTIDGNITNTGGMLSPGIFVGVITITGNYVQGPTGAFAVELTGNVPGFGYDQVIVGGAATIAGTLIVELVAYNPNVGDSFTLLDGTVNGTIGEVKANQLSGPRDWEIDVATDAIDLSVVAGVGSLIASDDTYEVGEDSVLSIPAPGVLDNDFPPNNETLTVQSFDAVSQRGAVVQVNLDGSFRYDPTSSASIIQLAEGAELQDRFTYTMTDGNTAEQVTVTVTVVGRNDAPRAVDDVESLLSDEILNVAASGVLLNDTDPDLSSSLDVLSFDAGSNVLGGPGVDGVEWIGTTSIDDSGYGGIDIDPAVYGDAVNLRALATGDSGTFAFNVGTVIDGDQSRLLGQLLELDSKGRGNVVSLVHQATLSEDRPATLLKSLPMIEAFAIDPVSGMAYTLSEGGTGTTLHRIDIHSGTVTHVGTLFNQTLCAPISGVAAAAFNSQGDLFILAREADGDPDSDLSGNGSSTDVAMVRIDPTNATFTNSDVHFVLESGIESMANYTAMTFMDDLTLVAIDRSGIGDELQRISVGFEDAITADVIGDVSLEGVPTRIEGLAVSIGADGSPILVGVDHGSENGPRLVQVNTNNGVAHALSRPGTIADVRGLSAVDDPSSEGPLLIAADGTDIVRGSSVTLPLRADGTPDLIGISAAAFRPNGTSGAGLLYFVAQTGTEGRLDELWAIDVTGGGRSSIQNTLRRVGLIDGSSLSVSSLAWDQITSGDELWSFRGDTGIGQIIRLDPGTGAILETMDVRLDAAPASTISGMAVIYDDPSSATPFFTAIFSDGANSELVRIRRDGRMFGLGQLSDHDDTTGTVRGENLHGLTWASTVMNPFTHELQVLLATDVTTDELVYVDHRPRVELFTPNGAIVKIEDDGAISYDPLASQTFIQLPEGDIIVEAITYVVSDDRGLSSEASLVVSVTGAPRASEMEGDINRDGKIDAADIDELFAAMGSSPTHEFADLIRNGIVDDEDADYLIEEILGTRRGDADLNGKVDFADFLTLSANFGKSASWQHADFTGDGKVTFQDFLLLSSSFGWNRALAFVR